jgi:hypothetical protein
MTIEALAVELSNDDGSYDRSRAVSIHTRTVAAAAVSIESVIEDLDLLNRESDTIDPAEILDALADYAEDEAARQLLGVLAGAARQLREVTLNLPADQALLIEELIGRLQSARSLDDLYAILAFYESNQIPGVSEGASYAREILQDGEESIYNPQASPVAAVAASPGDPPQDRNDKAVLGVAVDDAAGGVAGGAAGAFFFGVGALPGAVGGAIGNSVLAVATRTLKRLLHLK